MDMVESLSVEELPRGGHPDDRYALTAHLPSGESIAISAHRTHDEVLEAFQELTK
jgi:hypothetical protein